MQRTYIQPRHLNQSSGSSPVPTINSKAKGLSSSLLDFHESKLLKDFAGERPELFVALHLNDSTDSPWYKQLDLGGQVTSGMTRRASLRTMQKAVKRFMAASGILEEETPQTIAELVEEYWAAVASSAIDMSTPPSPLHADTMKKYVVFADAWKEICD